MSKLPTLPELGRIVEIVRGRDSGLVCVVIGQEADRFVLLADGHIRKAEKPKKKNVLHVRITPHFAQEVIDELQKHGRVTNAKLRHALRLYHSANGQSDEEAWAEGGVSNGER